MYGEDEFLMLSGIQHYYFCKRQWALIHIEQQWLENDRTIEGKYIHSKADKPLIKEKRNDVIISRAVPISSKRLGLSGITDIIEFRRSEGGVNIANRDGLWLPSVVEYKKGKEKADERDIVQLCAQIMCLEEEFNIKLENGYLFYFETNSKIEIKITDELRNKVAEVSKDMHRMYEQKTTPKAEHHKNCTLCSLYNLCMPNLIKRKPSVENYLFGDK